MRPDARADDGRDETANERYDRNWQEILQELRVTQTGTQILTGFLLAVAFQPRFAELDLYQRTVYLVLVALAAITTLLGLTPVSLHRTLFAQGRKGTLVRVADSILRVILVAVAALVIGVVLLILDVTVGRVAGVIGGVVALVLVAVAWLFLPRLTLQKARQREEPASER